MKNYYFITNAAVKYWKKEVKNGNLRVATLEGQIYIVNSYNAFIIPAGLYSAMVQPATLQAAPEEGRAYIWKNGKFSTGDAADVAAIVTRAIDPDAPNAERTAFSVDHKTGAARIYKLEGGELAPISGEFDAMLNHDYRHTIQARSTKSAFVFKTDGITAVIMPIYYRPLNDEIKKLVKEDKNNG